MAISCFSRTVEFTGTSLQFLRISAVSVLAKSMNAYTAKFLFKFTALLNAVPCTFHNRSFHDRPTETAANYLMYPQHT